MTKKQNIILSANLIVYLSILVWIALINTTFVALNTYIDPNSLFFVPLGLYTYVFLEKNSIAQRFGMIVATSLLFELAPYILASRATDIIDLTNNIISGVLGLVICYAAKKVLKERFKKTAVATSLLYTLAMVAIMLFVHLHPNHFIPIY